VRAILSPSDRVTLLISTIEVSAFLGGLLFGVSLRGSAWEYPAAAGCVAVSIFFGARAGRRLDRALEGTRMTAPFKSEETDGGTDEDVRVVSISDIQYWSNSAFGAGGFLLTLYSVLSRRYEAPVISRAQMEEWIKRRSDTDFDPYHGTLGDHLGNKREEIRIRFQGFSVGIWIFIIGFTVWATTFLLQVSYVGPLPATYATGVSELESIAALIALSGGVLTFVCVRSLSDPKRRQVMAFIALLMGYERKEPKKVLVALERTDPVLEKLVAKTKPKRAQKPRPKRPPTPAAKQSTKGQKGR